MKPVLTKKPMTVYVYIRKDEKSTSNSLSFHLKKMREIQQCKPKANRRKEILKIRAEINKIINRKSIAKKNQ